MLPKRTYLIFLFLFVFVMKTYANTNVTSGGSLNLCVSSTYTTMGNITISEGGATDFVASGSLQTYEINAPSNFEFNPNKGSVVGTGADIIFSSLTVTSSKITLYYFLNSTATTDKFVLSNIEIRATSPSGTQNLVRTAGSAVQTGNNTSDNKVHAQLASAQAFVSLITSTNIVCASGSDVNLNGSPNGGSYSTTSNSLALTGNTFKPSIAGAGNYVITYTANNNGCTGIDTVHIVVKSSPVVTFFGLASSYCSNDDDVSLTGFPGGGIFTGDGIVNNTFFRASTAGVGTNKSVSYEYTSNGCSNKYTLPTSVKQSPSQVSISLIPSKSNYFTQDDSVVISGSQNINIPSNGSVYVSGNGIVKGSDNVYRFFPNVVGAGTYTISRTVTASSNNCSTSKDTTITVSPSSGSVISGLGETYCKSSGNVNMSVSNDYGAYSISYLYESAFINLYLPYGNSNGVIQDNDHTNGLGIFKPSLLDIGKYRIEFAGTTKGTIYAYIEIVQSSTIAVNIGSSYCSGDPEITIDYVTSVPGNVTFSGKRVDNGKFDPGSLQVFGNDTIFYEYTQVSNGCVSSGFVITKVNPTPTNVFFAGLQSDKIYCDGDADSELKPNLLISPSGGVGRFTSTDGIIKIGQVTYFSSSIAVKSNVSNSESYDINFVYTSAEGCSQFYSQTVQVNKLPSVGLGGLNSKYCFGDSPISMTGFPNGGTYTISTLPSNTIGAGTLSGNTFNPRVATPSTYYIKYQYTDNTNAQCTNSSMDTVVVHRLPTVSFTGLNEKYCDKDLPSILLGSNADQPGTTYAFSSIPSGAVAGNSFYPQNLGVGKYIVSYLFTDENTCSNSVKDSTIVFGQPTSHFKLSTLCEDDLIELRDSFTVLNQGAGVSFSQINKWVWDIDNKIFNKRNLDTSLSAGGHIIKYTTITDQGCQNTQSKPITIGSYPEINFSWDEICNQQNTQFKNLSTIGVGEIDTLRWDFSNLISPGDFIRTDPPDPLFGNTSHKFSQPGVYAVSLTGISDYKCKAVYSQNIYILPAKVPGPNTPYANDFQADGGGWISSSVADPVSTWIWGLPKKSVINTFTQNDSVWVTNLIGYNKPNEQSYVYSPCFSMDSLKRPMISLDIWGASIDKLSGAALQYSYDGKVWETLGKNEKGKGIHWYDDFGIAGNPGEQSVGQYGWSYMDSVGFKNARYTLDNEIALNKNIRFRVAFGSTQSISDGFAFDNVWVGERTKMLLIEQFTNNAYPVTKTENEKFYSTIAEYPLDVVGLQYHVGYSLPDPFYNRNTADPGARSLYNGVATIPYAVINGSESAGHPITVLQDTTIIKAILEDPGFKITMNPVLSSSNISGDVTITANKSVSSSVTLYISALERYVSNVTGNSGETNYQWVHAKFLPDAAGTGFTNSWAKGNSATVTFDWNYLNTGVYDSGKLAIIAFVQDNVTKEIYQAAYKGLGATLETGVFDPVEATSTVTLYPNPANDITTVILNGKLAGEYNWVIIDELGRTVGEGALTDGTDGFTINTQNYASGFYTLRLSNGSDGVKTQKFVVMH